MMGNNTKTRVLFLYSELAGYMVDCLNHAARSQDFDVTVVRWPVNPEAPFNFEFEENLRIVDKADVDLKSLATEFKPQVVVTSGWFDSDYLGFVKRCTGNVVKILTFDNHWKGSLKQNIGKFILPFKVVKYYDAAWVPGSVQEAYGIKIGFRKENIFDGYYAANFGKFDRLFQARKANNNIAKKFLYVGRYLDWKGIFELWSAFKLIKQKYPDWELHCLGQGDQWDNRIKADGIFHHGFLPDTEFFNFGEDAAAIVIPSHFEHWGVVVQEFAGAGLPILSSSGVGANCFFVEDGKNGFIFKPKCVDSLFAAMEKIILMERNELNEFGVYSHKLAAKITPEYWLNQLRKIIRDNGQK